MRRRLAVATLAIALASPATVVAAIRHFDGHVDPSGTVSFDAKWRLGRVRQVAPGFAFSGIGATCDGGHQRIMGSFDFGMEVRRRRFDGTGSYGGGGKVTISGEFTRTGRRATGTIEVSGDFNAIGATGCHGMHDWTARRA